MFPYAMCEARLDSGIAEVLKQIYSVEPATELYFVNASAKAFNGYLNISVAITNQGLLNAEKFNLDLYADGNKLEPVEIDPIEVGQTSMLKVSNIKLPRKAISLLEMDINYLEKEFDKANNKISIRLESLE